MNYNQDQINSLVMETIQQFNSNDLENLDDDRYIFRAIKFPRPPTRDDKAAFMITINNVLDDICALDESSEEVSGGEEEAESEPESEDEEDLDEQSYEDD